MKKKICKKTLQSNCVRIANHRESNQKPTCAFIFAAELLISQEWSDRAWANFSQKAINWSNNVVAQFQSNERAMRKISISHRRKWAKRIFNCKPQNVRQIEMSCTARGNDSSSHRGAANERLKSKTKSIGAQFDSIAQILCWFALSTPFKDTKVDINAVSCLSITQLSYVVEML